MTFTKREHLKQFFKVIIANKATFFYNFCFQFGESRSVAGLPRALAGQWPTGRLGDAAVTAEAI